MRTTYEMNNMEMEIRQGSDYAMVKAVAYDYDIREKLTNLEIVKRFKNCVKDVEKFFYKDANVSAEIEELFVTVIARATWDKPSQAHHQYVNDNIVVDINIDNQSVSVGFFKY